MPVSSFAGAVIDVCRRCLALAPRSDRPLDWARTQNDLGNALVTLGERESKPARLEEAVAAYREALQEFTCERVPLQWAKTQLGLGNALARHSERESGTTSFGRRAKVMRHVLIENLAAV